ncbi:HEAT repeat domain-containing protein [Streptomyces sp. NPDC056367]|uniref:HEAT repeat domain-containing protein n=1 Tax=Streptomyces sp. NPDC056367 TaxID=3345797 RepID=UPI0035DF3913
MGITGEPDREQLLRAVEGGSPEEVGKLLDAGPGPATAPELREELLATAHGWYEEGAEARLRRLTGAVGPARTRSVAEGENCRVTEITLGGRTVRDGHGGILTLLEWTFRILTPVEELVTRAVRHGDREHCDWGQSESVFFMRQSPETWAQKVAFHRHPDPLRRLFVAELLGMEAFGHSFMQHARWYERKRLEVLAGWVEVEDDGAVLAELLWVVENEDFPGTQALGLRHARHPDPRVRRRVPELIERPLTAETVRVIRDLCRDPDGEVRARAAQMLGGEELREEDRPVLLGLLRDPDPEVVRWAASATARGYDRSPEITGALVELLDSADPDVRLSAAYGLALRDDPRTEEAYGKVEPLGPELEGDHRSEGLWRWRAGMYTQARSE